MKDIQTRISHDRDGWSVTSTLDLADNRLLRIHTYKSLNGVLRTSATVHTKVDGGLRHVMGYGTPGGDFSEELVRSKPARATEKVVTAQHDCVLKTLPGVLAAVDAHYVKHPATPAFA
jgi:hypothetical protein